MSSTALYQKTNNPPIQFFLYKLAPIRNSRRAGLSHPPETLYWHCETVFSQDSESHIGNGRVSECLTTHNPSLLAK